MVRGWVQPTVMLLIDSKYHTRPVYSLYYAKACNEFSVPKSAS